MSFVQNIYKHYQKRSYSDLGFLKGEDYINSSGLSFFDPTQFMYASYNGAGQIDSRYTAQAISTVFLANPVAFGILNKIQDLILSREYGFFGKNEEINKYYRKLLDLSGFRKRLKEGIIPAFWGTGGGNVLYYSLIKNNRLEIKAEPFVTNGFQRVQVRGDFDNTNLEVKGYDILNSSRRTVYSFDADDVYHLKYSAPDGNYMFGSSPIIVLAKQFMTKLRAMAANETVFQNGLQASYLVGLDAQKMISSGANATNILNAENKLKEELKQASGLRGRNSFVYTGVPLTMEKIQLSNVEMETIKILDVINQETFSAYGVDPAVLDTSKSKYDNADIAMDNLYTAINPKIEEIVRAEMEYSMPRLDPKYNPEKYPFRMAYEPTKESMELKKIKQDDLKIFFDFLIKSKDVGLIVQPTADKARELKELGIDLSEYDVLPSTEPQSAEDFVSITDTFTNITKPEQFATQRSNNRIYENLQTSLDDKFKKIVSYD
jgi:hypothetical protein